MIGSAAFALALAPNKPLLLVHVMPWFEAPPVSKGYGYHWTMRKESPPEKWASHFRPSIGLYDSLDPVVIENQVALIKLAGFDGILADWYGPEDFWDYLSIHQRTQALFEVAEKAGLKVGVVWEDQTIKHRVEQGGFTPGHGLAMGERALRFVLDNWAKKPSWLEMGGKPSLLVFGPQHLKDGDWPPASSNFRILTLHHKRGPASGSFDWPIPSRGFAWHDEYEKEAKGLPWSMATAYPRFHDYYAEAGAREGFPRMPDREGRTYRETLERGIKSGAFAVQVATWNDWGEGTQIEPSEEYGLRDLAATQEIRKARIEPRFRFKVSDLELAMELYFRRRMAKSDSERAALKAASDLLLSGEPTQAREKMRDAKM